MIDFELTDRRGFIRVFNKKSTWRHRGIVETAQSAKTNLKFTYLGLFYDVSFYQMEYMDSPYPSILHYVDNEKKQTQILDI